MTEQQFYELDEKELNIFALTPYGPAKLDGKSKNEKWEMFLEHRKGRSRKNFTKAETTAFFMKQPNLIPFEAWLKCQEINAAKVGLSMSYVTPTLDSVGVMVRWRLPGEPLSAKIIYVDPFNATPKRKYEGTMLLPDTPTRLTFTRDPQKDTVIYIETDKGAVRPVVIRQNIIKKTQVKNILILDKFVYMSGGRSEGTCRSLYMGPIKFIHLDDSVTEAGKEFKGGEHGSHGIDCLTHGGENQAMPWSFNEPIPKDAMFIKLPFSYDIQRQHDKGWGRTHGFAHEVTLVRSGNDWLLPGGSKISIGAGSNFEFRFNVFTIDLPIK